MTLLDQRYFSFQCHYMSLDSLVGLLVLKGLCDFLFVGWLQLSAFLSLVVFTGLLLTQLEENEEFIRS